MRAAWLTAGVATLLLSGCGDAPAPLLRGSPAASLLTIDQLVAPDFTVDVAPHPLSVADVVAADGGDPRTLQSDGFTAAAGEDFFRNVGALRELNGPVQIHDTIAAFGTSIGAASVFSADAHRLDAVSGSTAISTGALGDEAHATQRTADAGNGVTAIEITVEWRVENVVNVLVVRGRFGGTRLEDALLLAHVQTANELGLTTPTATPTSTAGHARSAQPGH